MEVGPIHLDDEGRSEASFHLAPGEKLDLVEEPVVLRRVIPPAAHDFRQHHRAERPARSAQRRVHGDAESRAGRHRYPEETVATGTHEAQHRGRAAQRVERVGVDASSLREQRRERRRIDAHVGECAEFRARPLGLIVERRTLRGEEGVRLREGALHECAELGDRLGERRNRQRGAGIRWHIGRAPRR